MPETADTDDPLPDQPPREALEPKFLPPAFPFAEPCDAR